MTRAKKAWTVEEEEYLAQWYGRRPIKLIAKKLKRTPYAIEVHAERKMGIYPKSNSGQVTANELANILKVDNHAVTDYWIAKLKMPARKRVIKYKSKFWRIDVEEFWKWAENHTDKINFTKMERGLLLPEPNWLDEVIKMQLEKWGEKRFKKWTAEEDSRLIMYVKLGKTYKEIAELLGRTKSSVEHRHWRLVKKRKLTPKKIHILWTEEEKELVRELERQGLSDKEIAYEIGREPEHLGYIRQAEGRRKLEPIKN